MGGGSFLFGMESNWLDVANDALNNLGSPSISSFDDKTKAANLAKNTRKRVVDYVLGEHSWACAQERLSLPPDAQAPAFGYQSQFTMPADGVRLLLIENVDPQRYKIEGNRVLANTDVLHIVYIKVPDFPVYLRPYVKECISWYWAVKMAYSLCQDSNLRQECLQNYTRALQHGKHLNASENPHGVLTARHLLNIKLGGR